MEPKFAIHTADARHYTVINSWLEERGLANVPASEIPKDGLLIHGRNGYIAGGFLRQCEGGIALIDSYITNPSAPAEDRNAALEIMTVELFTLAKKRGYTKMIVCTKDTSIVKRAMAHGFAVIDQVLLGKAL